MARGGKRPGAGRPTGATNKSTDEVRELAGQHGPAAIERLAHLMAHAQSEAAQVAAASGILDRAYGKAPQAHTGQDGGPIEVIARLAWLAKKSGT